jgi:hypothetical protein
VVGFQFHLETTSKSAATLIDACGDELDVRTYVQDAQTMLTDKKRFERLNQTMYDVLDALGA